MSILQLTHTPVSVYRSTDIDAPQLNANEGSLKTILKACLVTGYGDTEKKTSLNWQMPYETDSAAAFKSNADTATGCYLKVDHNRPRQASITGYRNMSGIDDGTDRYIHERTNGNFPLLKNTVKTSEWVLVGHDKAFIFIILNTFSGTSKCLFFGDFPSYAAADTGNNLLWHTNDNRGREYIDNGSEELPMGRSNGLFTAALSANQFIVGQGVAINSRCAFDRGRTYPDPITGGMQADAIDLHEYDHGDYYLRGKHPGLLFCSHDLSSIPDGTVLDNFDNSNDQFLKFSLYSSTSPNYWYLLVNISMWVA